MPDKRWDLDVEPAFLLGVHQYAFRSGEPARIIGVMMVKCTNHRNSDYRPNYHIQFKDGKTDLIPFDEVERGNYEVIRGEKLKRLALEAANALWAIAEGKDPDRDPKEINQDIYRMFRNGGYPPKTKDELDRIQAIALRKDVADE